MAPLKCNILVFSCLLFEALEGHRTKP